jgi:hypothetical protein
MAGMGLRVVGLNRVPPGLYADEACNGYDAYSILLTGRDHHGNFLPLMFQGFNDNRMPLFDYSLVPLIGAFGLSPAAVRLGAALWGTADLVAIVILAALMLGLPGAVVTAVLVAVSPWHLPLSRYGTEVILGSTTVSLAMACFFLWLKRHEDRWLQVGRLPFAVASTLRADRVRQLLIPGPARSFPGLLARDIRLRWQSGVPGPWLCWRSAFAGVPDATAVVGSLSGWGNRLSGVLPEGRLELLAAHQRFAQQ